MGVVARGAPAWQGSVAVYRKLCDAPLDVKRKRVTAALPLVGWTPAIRTPRSRSPGGARVHAVALRTPEKPTARRPHRDARSRAFGSRRVRLPVPSGITKWLCRQISKEVRPWNVRFARELPEDSPFAPREVIAGKDARTPA